MNSMLMSCTAVEKVLSSFDRCVAIGAWNFMSDASFCTTTRFSACSDPRWGVPMKMMDFVEVLIALQLLFVAHSRIACPRQQQPKVVAQVAYPLDNEAA